MRCCWGSSPRTGSRNRRLSRARSGFYRGRGAASDQGVKLYLVGATARGVRGRRSVEGAGVRVPQQALAMICVRHIGTTSSVGWGGAPYWSQSFIWWPWRGAYAVLRCAASGSSNPRPHGPNSTRHDARSFQARADGSLNLPDRAAKGPVPAGGGRSCSGPHRHRAQPSRPQGHAPLRRPQRPSLCPELG